MPHPSTLVVSVDHSRKATLVLASRDNRLDRRALALATSVAEDATLSVLVHLVSFHFVTSFC